MKRERDPREYVDHIAEAMSHIAAWVAEGREQFENDYRTSEALIRTLQELTESVQPSSHSSVSATPKSLA